MLSGKNILIGITGGIAAYKTAHLVREFIKEGANVKCIQTPSSKSFITPLTLSTLSKNEVYSEFTSDEDNPRWNDHVKLALWAHLFLIAPATANTLSKMCQGVCDNLLIATYLSSKCQVYFAPAMDLDMYKHPSTIENLKKLKQFGNIMIPAEHGELASGLIGKGRMEEPEEIVNLMSSYFLEKDDFKGKKVVVTAGPTHESFDPVRFIGNNSSGKMGIAIADEFAHRGADVTLICGPSSVECSSGTINRINVTSASEMYDAVFSKKTDFDIAVMAAAVADYTPKETFKDKLKKKEGDLSIELIRTQDILKSLGHQKKAGQVLVGFAMETENEFENATKKLESKNADFIVLNSLNDRGAGFKLDTNKVTFIYPDNKSVELELKSKSEVANDIANTVKKILDD